MHQAVGTYTDNEGPPASLCWTEGATEAAGPYLSIMTVAP